MAVGAVKHSYLCSAFLGSDTMKMQELGWNYYLKNTENINFNVYVGTAERERCKRKYFIIMSQCVGCVNVRVASYLIFSHISLLIVQKSYPLMVYIYICIVYMINSFSRDE